jgi:hypothetical protein
VEKNKRAQLNFRFFENELRPLFPFGGHDGFSEFQALQPRRLLSLVFGN